MQWFGTSWGAAFCRECPQIPVPVGEVCYRCEEPIAEGNSGFRYINGPVAHRECGIRAAVGGLRHLQGRCTCCGGSEEPDPPGLTKREASRAVVHWLEEHVDNKERGT